MSGPGVKLTITFVIFPVAQPLNIFGPHDALITLLAGTDLQIDSPVSSGIAFVAETLSPIELVGIGTIHPQMTLEDAESEQWDASLVPGGPGARRWAQTNLSALEFIKTMEQNVKYVLLDERAYST